MTRVKETTELIAATLRLWKAGLVSSELAVDICNAIMKRHDNQ